MSTFEDKVLNTVPLAYWPLDDPLKSSGSTARDATGDHNGLYHIDPVVAGLIVEGGQPTDPCCNPGNLGSVFTGSVPFIAGVPDGGAPSGCAVFGGIPDLTHSDFTCFGWWTFSQFRDDGGVQGVHGISLGGIQSSLNGGIIGTLNGEHGSGFSGWSLYTRGAFTSDADYLNLIFRIGNNELDLQKPFVDLGQFCSAADPIHQFCIQKIGDVMQGTFDTRVFDYVNGFGATPWAASDGVDPSANPAQSDNNVYIGTQNFNLVLSGYWGNLQTMAEPNNNMGDFILYDRALSTDEIISVFQCYAAKNAVHVKRQLRVVRGDS